MTQRLDWEKHSLVGLASLACASAVNLASMLALSEQYAQNPGNAALTHIFATAATAIVPPVMSILMDKRAIRDREAAIAERNAERVADDTMTHPYAREIEYKQRGPSIHI